MDQTQHIVVYRSEQERAMDEFVMSGGPIPLVFGGVAFLVAFLLLNYCERFYLRTRRPSLGERRYATRDYTHHFLAVAAVVGVLVTCFTW